MNTLSNFLILFVESFILAGFIMFIHEVLHSDDKPAIQAIYITLAIFVYRFAFSKEVQDRFKK